MASTIKRFAAGYQDMEKRGLPGALGVQPSIVNTPMGKLFVAGFMWSSSDLVEGRRYLNEISSYGNVIQSTVELTTLPEWMKASEAFVPKAAYGSVCCVSLRELTDEVNDIVIEQVEEMPDDPAVMLSFHQLRGRSAFADLESVFGTQTPHYCIELIGASVHSQKAKANWDWAAKIRKALQQTDLKNVIPATYISLTPPNDSNSKTIFGEHWQKLVDIKQRYDPNNVFKHALPKFELPN